MKLFDPIELSETETVLVKECFSNPAVVKYLRGLAQDGASSLASAEFTTKSAEEVKHTVVFIQGGNAVLKELLEINS